MKIVDNLLTLLKGDDGKRRNKFIDNLPNAHQFKVVIQGKSIPWENEGISKSVKSHVEIVWGQNKRPNRYVEHQIKRLIQYREDGSRFWGLVGLLNKKSVVWYLVHLNKVFPTWYRSLPYHMPFVLMSKVRTLCDDFKGDVEHHRVYIPKTTRPLLEWLEDPDKKWRPLGVPTPEWRVYLSMLNTALTIWLERFWQSQQHGYFPRKGTMTCWIEILKRINEANIYEFDLKQFFPSVETTYVSKVLRSTGVPEWWVQYFENLNRSKPTLNPDPSKDAVDEGTLREAEELRKGILHKGQKWYKNLEPILACHEVYSWIREETGGTSLHHMYEYVQLQWAMLSSFKPEQPFGGTTKGLPQGGGISPTLSVQVLKPLFKENDAIMYADDGLIFGKKPKFGTNEMKEAGITLNEEKSGWIKKDGNWLKPLKFLGLIYDGWHDQLWSETRRGKTLKLEKNQLKRVLQASEWFTSEGKRQNTNTYLEALSSKIGGFIQAALYNGTYELGGDMSRWDLKASKRSWAASKTCKTIFKKKGLRANMYNASSVACRWFVNKGGKLRA